MSRPPSSLSLINKTGARIMQGRLFIVDCSYYFLLSAFLVERLGFSSCGSVGGTSLT